MIRAKTPVLRWAAALTLAVSAISLSSANLSWAKSGKNERFSAGPEAAWQQVAKKNKPGKGPKHKNQEDGLSYSYKAYDKKGGPPPWAPAHGYRRKHGGGNETASDDLGPISAPFGLNEGHCDRDVIGAVLGGTLGATVGSQIGEGDDKNLAILGGTVIGVIIGGAIGRAMDESDQTCVAQALEHLSDGEAIVWGAAADGPRFRVAPVATYEDNQGRFCREFAAAADLGGLIEQAGGVACRFANGAWRVL
jgi:surface antigen